MLLVAACEQNECAITVVDIVGEPLVFGVSCSTITSPPESGAWPETTHPETEPGAESGGASAPGLRWGI